MYFVALLVQNWLLVQDWLVTHDCSSQNVSVPANDISFRLVFVFTHIDPFHILPLPLMQEKVQLDGKTTGQFRSSQQGRFFLSWSQFTLAAVGVPVWLF